jgi:hypothetical protein
MMMMFLLLDRLREEVVSERKGKEALGVFM